MPADRSPSIAMVAYTHYESDPRCRREASVAAEAGWDVHFYALSQDGRRRTVSCDGIHLHQLPLQRYRGNSASVYMMSYLRFLVLAKAALLAGQLRWRFRIVHINTMPDFMVLAGLWPRILGAKIILDIHDVMPELYMTKFDLPASHWKPSLVRTIEVASARLAHVVLTAEHPKAKLLAEHGIPAEKIAVLLNLPDESVFRPEIMRREPLPLPDDPGADFHLVYHGTVAHRHGLDRAIGAVDKLTGDWPGIRLSILGEGDHLAALLEQVKRLGLGERVYFSQAYRPIEEIVPVLQTAHLAVIPTREVISTDYMLPTKLLEYLALGIPVICTPTRTVRHYFGDRHPLYLEDSSPEGVAAKIAWVRENYADAAALTLQARETFFRQYAWSTHKQTYVALLERLAGGGSESSS